MSGIRPRAMTCGIALWVFALGGAGYAQAQDRSESDGQTSAEEREDTANIIVTGTLVRGVAPAGANVVTVDQQRMEESGLTGSARLTEQLPQFPTTFNTFVAPQNVATIAVNRPNLRSLPGFQSSGGSTTLVLMDGVRIVGMGINSTGPDMDIVPPGAIARTEIVPDGGSAQYGSDAVAGVINMGTRRDYKGAEISVRHGFTDVFHNLNVDATVGRKWQTGSAYLSYSYYENNTLRGEGLDFIRTVPSRNTLINTFVTGLNCSPGTVIVNGTGGAPGVAYAQPYARGAGVPNTLNQCDPSREGVVFAAQRRHSALAGLSQELTDAIRLDLRGIYMNRRTASPGTFFRSNKTIAGAPSGSALVSPFYMQNQPVVTPLTNTHTVYFRHGPEDAGRSTNDLEAWQVTPTITADLGSTWQLRVHGTYGRSRLTIHSHAFNDTALDNAIKAGLFNPYDPASSNPAVVAAIYNYDGFQTGTQTLWDTRAVFDGDLFSVPGGAVKLAVGGEFFRESLANQVPSGAVWRGSQDTGFAGLTIDGVLHNGNTAALIPANGATARVSAARHVWAAFAELVVPVFSDRNELPLLREVTLSIAGRYDRYSDVGDTFNPRIGVTWRPIPWVALRGAWGSSFNAPSIANTQAMSPPTVSNIQGNPFIAFIGTPPQFLVDNGTYRPYTTDKAVITVGGAAAGIRPQTAKTLSLGADVDPPFIPGLRLSGTYWRISFKNQIGIPLQPYQNFPALVHGARVGEKVNPAELAQVLSMGTITGPALTCSGSDTDCVYAIVYAGINNLGDLLARGVDFSARYSTKTGFGSIDASFGGTYEIEMKRSTASGGPKTINELAARNALRLTGSLGANVGQFRGSVSWRHSHGYDVFPPIGAVAPFQTHVGSFNVFDAFFKIDFPKDGFDLTLNINNIFDESPPRSIAPGSGGTTNGQTYGRMALVGFTKKF